MSSSIIFIGGGGHTKVLLEILETMSVSALGYLAPEPSDIDLNYLGTDTELSSYVPDEVLLVNGIGTVGKSNLRQKLYKRYRAMGFRFATLTHPTSIVSHKVQFGEGVQILAGAILQTGTVIGENTIINTGSIVDHDCKIGDHVHIAPGVALSGGVIIENGVHIGTGACVIQGIRVGEGSTIGAGAVVIRDIPKYTTVVGNPAKEVPR